MNYTELLSTYGDICEEYYQLKNKKEIFLAKNLDLKAKTALDKQEKQLLAESTEYQELSNQIAVLEGRKARFYYYVQAIEALLKLPRPEGEFFNPEVFCGSLIKESILVISPDQTVKETVKTKRIGEILKESSLYTKITTEDVKNSITSIETRIGPDVYKDSEGNLHDINKDIEQAEKDIEAKKQLKEISQENAAQQVEVKADTGMVNEPQPEKTDEEQTMQGDGGVPQELPSKPLEKPTKEEKEINEVKEMALAGGMEEEHIEQIIEEHQEETSAEIFDSMECNSDKKQQLKPELTKKVEAEEIQLNIPEEFKKSSPKDLEDDKLRTESYNLDMRETFLNIIVSKGVDNNPAFLEFINLKLSEISRIIRFVTHPDVLNHCIHLYKIDQQRKTANVQTVKLDPSVEECLKQQEKDEELLARHAKQLNPAAQYAVAGAKKFEEQRKGGAYAGEPENPLN